MVQVTTLSQHTAQSQCKPCEVNHKLPRLQLERTAKPASTDLLFTVHYHNVITAWWGLCLHWTKKPRRPRDRRLAISYCNRDRRSATATIIYCNNKQPKVEGQKSHVGRRPRDRRSDTAATWINKQRARHADAGQWRHGRVEDAEADFS